MPIIQKGVLYLHTETARDSFIRNLEKLAPDEYEVHVHDAHPTPTMIELAKLAIAKGLQVFAKHPDMVKALNDAGIPAKEKWFSAIVQGELRMAFVGLH